MTTMGYFKLEPLAPDGDAIPGLYTGPFPFLGDRLLCPVRDAAGALRTATLAWKSATTTINGVTIRVYNVHVESVGEVIDEEAIAERNRERTMAVFFRGLRGDR